MKFTLPIALTITVMIAGLVSPGHAQRPQPAPLLLQVKADSSGLQAPEQPRGNLTLPQALALAMRFNPQLAAYSLEIRAREAAAIQAALLPNPELEIETENFAGSGALSAFKSSETTVSLGQLIELGGKRSKRKKVAAFLSDLAAWEYESKKLDVLTQTVTTFDNVLTAQKLVALNKEVLALSQTFKENIAKRVQAGRLSAAELARATVEVANARIALQRSQKELAAARLKLAAVWGAPQALFKQAKGQLDQTMSLPSAQKLQKLLAQNPDLARWQTVKNQFRAELDLAEAGRIPDPFIRAGWRKFNDSGDQAFVAGLSIPLPVFNRNQGARREAAVRVKQSARQEQAARLALQTMLNRQYQKLQAAYESLQSLKTEILPQARKAFEIIDKGYQQGKFGFLDVLDARRTLFASENAYLQSLRDYRQIRTQIERLIGQSLESVQ